MLKPLLPLAFTASILLTACGGSSSSAPTAVTPSDNKSPETETVSNEKLGMNLDLAQLKSAGVFADKIIVKITKGDFTKTIETNHTDYAASVEFSDLVVGEYAISVQIFDGETLVAEGSGTGAVNANQVATVNMSLELKSGGLVVNVNVPELIEGEAKLLAIEKTMVTTTDALEGGPLVSSGILGNILAEEFEYAVYSNDAAFTKLESGSSIEMNFKASYGYSETNEIQSVPVESNELSLRYNDKILALCLECTAIIQNTDGKLSFSYLNINLPEEVSDSIIDSRNGENNFDLMGFQLKHNIDVVVTFQKLDATNISLEDMNVESLLDGSKFDTLLTIKGRNSLYITSVVSSYSYGTLSASSVSQ